MEGNFGKALGVLIIALGLIVMYELVYPYVPTLHQFEPSHFWTGYDSTLSDTSQLEIDTSFLVEYPDTLQTDSSDFNLSDSAMTAEDSLSYILEDSLVFSKEDSLLMADLEHFTGIQNLEAFFQKLKEPEPENVFVLPIMATLLLKVTSLSATYAICYNYFLVGEGLALFLSHHMERVFAVL